MSNWDQCRRTFGWVNYLPNWLVCGLATLGPIGKIGPAPGTNGTAAGLVYAWALITMLPPVVVWTILLLSIYFAVAICDSAERRMKLSDPGCIILDEFIAIPFCVLPNVMLEGKLHGWPVWGVPLAVFLLFRLFDVAKPFGIKRLQKLPGGLGVVVDDVAAALATALVLNLWMWTT